MQRHGWKSRYHDEVLVQGLAPHNLDGYLLQRDRWARGNLAVFTLPESPLRAGRPPPPPPPGCGAPAGPAAFPPSSRSPSPLGAPVSCPPCSPSPPPPAS